MLNPRKAFQKFQQQPKLQVGNLNDILYVYNNNNNNNNYKYHTPLRIVYCQKKDKGQELPPPHPRNT